MKNILVTGGAGYIGSHIIELLIKKNLKVFIIDNLSTGYKKLINKKAKFFKADINQYQLVRKIIKNKNIDSIIHLAAKLNIAEGEKNPKIYYKNNISGTLNLLKACKDTNVKNFVFSSTCAVYSDKYLYVKENSITILILFVLTLMTYEFSSQDISYSIAIKIFWIDTICCIMFLFNFFFELKLSKSKKWYWKTHWVDFITSIPIPDAKILRFGRLVRLLRLMRVLKFLRVILLLFRGMESFKELFDIKIMRKTLSYSFMLMFIASLTIIYFENKPEEINNFTEALWWSFTTLVTGGFADIYNPITAGGMIITIILVIAGMALIGVFIAALSNVIDTKSDSQNDSIKNYIDEKFDELNKKLEK